MRDGAELWLAKTPPPPLAMASRSCAPVFFAWKPWFFLNPRNGKFHSTYLQYISMGISFNAQLADCCSQSKVPEYHLVEFDSPLLAKQLCCSTPRALDQWIPRMIWLESRTPVSRTRIPEPPGAGLHIHCRCILSMTPYVFNLHFCSPSHGRHLAPKPRTSSSLSPSWLDNSRD